MRVMIVNGSPRKGGYTSDLAALFKKGAESAGGETDELFLRQKKITPCIGCFKCWVGETAGRCIFSDDMDDIIERYLCADALVLASPMYYYTFSSLTKLFLERLFPTTQPGLDTGGALGLGRNRPRFSGRGPDKCVLIATCGLRNPKTMHAMVSTFELICDAIAAEPLGVMLRPESNLLDFTQAKPKVMRKVVSSFTQAGAELVQDGRISPQTQQNARTPFSSDEQIFAAHFESYWTIAGEMGAEWTNRKALAVRANEDPRIIIRELAGYFNPKVAGDRTAVIQFVITDASHGQWHFDIAQGKCTAKAGLHPAPTVKMTMNYRTFSDIALQKTASLCVIQRGLMEIEGDKRLLAEFSRLFPRPEF
jgi:multimeric flavodoxin WrbA